MHEFPRAPVPLYPPDSLMLRRLSKHPSQEREYTIHRLRIETKTALVVVNTTVLLEEVPREVIPEAGIVWLSF